MICNCNKLLKLEFREKSEVIRRTFMMDVEPQKLELFTGSHGDHDDRWTVHASDIDITCFACLMELLEDQDIVLIKKKFVLSELLRLLSYHAEYLLEVLSDDFRVIVHTTVILLDLMEETEETFASMAAEGILKLVMSVKVDYLICGLIDSASEKCLKACNYKSSVPLFNLVGKLLQASPPLAAHLLQVYGSFVDFLCVGLTYPDANVHISVSYIFICLYALHSRTFISAQLSQQVATHVLEVLNSSSLEHDSMMNILGLMRVMLEDNTLVSVYTSLEGLCSAFKKVILGRDQMLQIAAVQCLVAVIAKSHAHKEMFLDKDMAEFLFEALSTCNELLISSLFCCLILFTDSDAFFSRCHAVYGMEAVLRALEQAMRGKNPDCIQRGLQLLAVILQRHSGGVRLFSCGSVVRQCLGLVNAGVQHHNFQLSDHAITALIHILRREHLPSPVPYNALLAPIHSLLLKVDRCPRMHCPPVEPSQLTSRKGSEAGVTSWRTEQKIRAALTIVNKACNLAILCGADPYASEETFTAPSQQQHSDDEVVTTTTGSLQQFIYSLLRIVDESCVPVFMANYKYLRETDVFIAFLSLLCHVFELWPDAVDSLARKLVFAGVVRLTLEVSTNNGHEVKNCAVNFLCHLLRHFMDDENCLSENLRQDLCTGVSELIVSYSCDVVRVLQLAVTESRDISLRCVHYAAVTLLYLADTHDDRLASEERVCDAIQTYISLNSPLDTLPHPVFKCLLLLLAGSCLNAGQQTIPEVTQSVVDRVRQCEQTAFWCSRDPVLLRWCFSSVLTAESFGAQLVQFWMSQDDGEKEHEDDSRCPSQCLLTVAQSSTICVETLMNMLMDGPLECILKVALCLRSLLRSKQEGRTSENAALIKHVLPDILQRLLLNFSRGSDTLSVSVLMELYTEVKHQTPSDPLTPGDLSLAYHACSVLATVLKENQPQQQQHRQKSLKQSSFRFLSSLLVQSLYHGDNRVGTLLCSNASLLGLVELDMEESAGGCGSRLLTLLLMQHSSTRVDHTVHVDVMRLQSLLTSDPALATSTLMFWSAYLDTAHVTPALVTLTKNRQREQLLETNVKLQMDTGQLRLLFIYIQQHLVQDNELVQEACLSCLESVFKYVQDMDMLCKHLTQQPWMEFVLYVAFSQHQGGGQLPHWLWRFSDILLRYHVPYLTSKHLAALVTCFTECDNQAVDSSMVKLVTQVLDKSLLKLDSHIVNIAKSKLEACGSRTTESVCARQALMMAAVCSLTETDTY